MLAWYWYILGVLAVFGICFLIEEIVDFWVTWPFEE